MSDLDKFIKNTEDTVEKVRKAIAEYEQSADALERLPTTQTPTTTTPFSVSAFTDEYTRRRLN